MGIELELFVLLVLVITGTSFLAPFEVETSPWKKLAKWSFATAVTIGLYYVIGHWSLVVLLTMITAGIAVHVIICRKEGFHLLRATPRRRYYAFRGWEWPET
jgi:hypothetical protein